MTFSAGRNETEIDFVLVDRKNGKYLKDVKTITRKLHDSFLTWLREKLKSDMRKGKVERKTVWKLKGRGIISKFEERNEKLISIDAPDLWRSVKE